MFLVLAVFTKDVSSSLLAFLLMTAILTQGASDRHNNVNGPVGKTQNVRNGMWGGMHIGLEVSDSGARVVYDCAHGTIDQPMTLNSTSNFDVTGSHVRERGGPLRRGEGAEGEPVRYTGRIQDETMTVTVTLMDSKEAIGTFTLTYGATPRIRKCL